MESARSRSAPRAGLIPYQKHVLDNGLEVLLHEDPSEPVVAVYVYYHVGSSREERGRSGFAHLFEHMLFQGSAHVPDNDHFRRIQEVGGALNGTTNQDRTNYFETLPAEELELALWLESDRMGFLLPAMTQDKLDNQRDVVMNERRQSYENRPYGLVHEALLTALYPEGHPYSWPTIGSMADIAAATLEDVARFFRRWYGPNNATLAIGGAFSSAAALRLVERYFGNLPSAPPVERPRPEPAQLLETRRVVLEDRVQLPQLTLCWPTVPAGHPDEIALDLLGDYLSANKSSVLDRALMVEAELASLVTISHAAQERAGTLTIQLRPHTGVSLTQLEARVEELLHGLARDGFDPARLARLVRRREGELFRSLETVAARTGMLAHQNLFHGDPGRLDHELARWRSLGAEDVQAALATYLLGRPRVVLSCVPAGRHELAALRADPPERRATRPEPERRSAPRGSVAQPFRSPPMWSSTLANGVRVLGTTFDRVPLTRLSLSFQAGRAFEPRGRAGLAALVAEMLEEGTRSLSGTEFLDELDGLGAQFSVAAGDEDLLVRLSVLDECLPRAIELLSELVLEPRFAATDFERLRRARLIELETRIDRIQELAEDAFDRLVFGSEHWRGLPRPGTKASVTQLALSDVREHWRGGSAPARARLAIVGAHDATRVAELFAPLVERWSGPAGGLERHHVLLPRARAGVRLSLLDKPGAAQSELRLGHLGVASTDPDFYPLQALNHVLGGAFSSRLNLNLREDKGYTYGVRSTFEGGVTPGAFQVSCAVASAVTAPALVEARAELEGLRAGVTQDELEFVRRSLTRTLSRSLESTQARLQLLENIARHGFPLDVLERRLAWLAQAERADLLRLAQAHVRPEDLEVLVVGDGNSVLGQLEALGWGEIQELDTDGAPRVPARAT